MHKPFGNMGEDGQIAVMIEKDVQLDRSFPSGESVPTETGSNIN